MATPKRGITASRVGDEKLCFIIDNYASMTRAQIATALNETPRWVKRQIHLLIASGKLKPHHELPEKFLSISTWTEPVKARILDLQHHHLKTREEICAVLKEEFKIIISPTVLQYWLNQLGFDIWTKRDWLREHIKRDFAASLLQQSLRIEDISKVIEKQYGLYFSDDLILIHLRELGLSSQKVLRIQQSRNKVPNPEELSKLIKGRVSISEISRMVGASTTVIHKKRKEAGIELLDRRLTWSDTMDGLRQSLLMVDPVVLPPDRMHQAILGWLLGDGHLDTYGRFVTNHSIAQVGYLRLKARVLRGYLTNVVTVPRSNFSGPGLCLGGKEQLGISCPGLDRYLEYLLPDGSKNKDKIFAELDDFGWACYYMDDGSLLNKSYTMSVKKDMLRFSNHFRFKGVYPDNKHQLVVDGIRSEFIIPGMAYKVVTENVGSFWKLYVPEYFSPVVSCDLDLSLINTYLCEKDASLLNRCVSFYHQRGFPFPSFSEVYLKKEWQKLIDLDTNFLWKEGGSLRFSDAGSLLFKHFMPHMVEARYRGTSPKETFDGFLSLRKTLEYCLRSERSILPDTVYSGLVFFNGGVVGFPATITKAIVQRLCPEGGLVVDPCSGWGGRLLGCSAAGRDYVGFEPWEKTADGLRNLIDFCSIVSAKVLSSPFDSEFAPKSCQLVFTSPPWIDLEVYGNVVDEQVWKNLMQSIIEYAQSRLTEGGVLALHLPEALRAMLPGVLLKEEPPIRWHKSPRSKDLKRSEIVWVWRR